MTRLILAFSMVTVLAFAVWGQNASNGQAHAGLKAHRQEARNSSERRHHRRNHHHHHKHTAA
jgi:hypothetical protein